MGELRSYSTIRLFFCALVLAAFTAASLTFLPSLLHEQVVDDRMNLLLVVASLLLLLLIGIVVFSLLVRIIRRSVTANTSRHFEPFTETVRSLIRLCLVVAAFIICISLLYGVIALLIAFVAGPSAPADQIKGTIDIVTLLITVFLMPLPVLLLGAFCLYEGRIRALLVCTGSSLRQGYLKLLACVVVGVFGGYIVQFLLGFLQPGFLATTISVISTSVLGAFWLLVCLAFCAQILPHSDDGQLVVHDAGISKSIHQLGGHIKTYSRSLLCVVLSSILTVTMIPYGSLAFADELPVEPIEEIYEQPAYAQPDTTNPGVDAQEPTESETKDPLPYYPQEEAPGELVEADGESVTYQTGDNSFATVIGGVSSTYTDEHGNLQLIDNTLEPIVAAGEIPAYANKANDFTAELPFIITTDEGVKIEKDGHAIELIPSAGDFTRSKTEGNAILYSDVFAGIDFQYTLIGSVIKEDIVLNRETDISSFSYRLLMDKDLAASLVDGAVVITTTEGKDPVFVISAPVMVDASGVASDELGIRIDSDEDGELAFTVSANEEWLHAPERAYPVRIDPEVNIAPSAVSLIGVEQAWPNLRIGDNGYPYAGYDDGITSGNASINGIGHWMTRTYVSVNYNFTYIMSEAKINSATFSVHHFTSWSHGSTSFGLFRVVSYWDPNTITWSTQTGLNHEAIQYKPSNYSTGYIDWDVRDTVNSWVQGLYPQYGLVIKAENENAMQCEVFSNKNSAYPPKLTINWEVPDPVSDDYPLSDLTVNLRPINEHDIEGKLAFDAVFADGIATPRAQVSYSLKPDDDSGMTVASRSYLYPDSSPFESVFPEGTRYKDKLSNWQSVAYGNFDLNTLYWIDASAALGAQVSPVKTSDTFLIYEVKQKDTLPQIAAYYGVPLSTLIADNRVHDTLAIENNTLFIRNPKTKEAYNPPPLTDDMKRIIDSALIGRGKHCEYGFEPINLNTGNFFLEAIDASIPDLGGDFTLARAYNAKAVAYQSLFGKGWSFTYAENISQLEDGRIAYFMSDGKILYFIPDGHGGYTGPEGFGLTLTREEVIDGTETYYSYTITETSGAHRVFNTWGLLSDVYSAQGHHTELGYDTDFRLTSLTSPSGKVFALTLDERGRVVKITLPTGALFSYAYDEKNHLISYTDANGKITRYEYDENDRMSAWYDKSGNRVLSNSYDGQGRVIEQTDALGNRSTLRYTATTTTATDALGNVTVYTYDDQYRTTKIEYPDGTSEERSYGPDNTLVSDKDGTYTYDANGNLTSAVAPDGTSVAVTYNAMSLPTSSTDQAGRTTVFQYDNSGNLINTTNPDGTTESFTYDDAHRLLTHTNAAGSTESFAWDGANIAAHTDFNGNTETFAYNGMNQLISSTDAEGNTSRVMYDAQGNMTGTQDATGAYEGYTLNAVGGIIALTDARGYTTSFVVDAAYRVTSATDPEGNTTTYTYDANGNKLSETNAKGETTRYAFDTMNRPIKMTLPDGGYTLYGYDGDGNIISTEDARGAKTTTSYNAVTGLPVSYTDASGYTSTFEYSSTGELKKTSNPDGSILRYSYDAAGRLTEFLDEGGLRTTLGYTPTGAMVSLDEGGRVFAYTYDRQGNLLTGTDPLGGVASYEYDKAGRLIRSTDEEGRQSSYTYDAAGRLLAETDPTGAVISYAYDMSGNMTSTTDAAGNSSYLKYDGLNRVIELTDAAGNKTTYTYDTAENLATITDPLGHTTQIEYNGLRLPEKVIDPLGQIWEYDYDQAGNNTAISSPAGDTQTIAYDLSNQPVKTTDYAGLVTEYSYDWRGNVVEARDSTGAYTGYTYDLAGRPISQKDATGRESAYSYDIWSNVTLVKELDQTTRTYGYDELGRVTTASNTQGAQVELTYDKVGNITGQWDTSKASGYSYTYDSANRMVAVTDPLGATTTFTYDAAGNPVSETDALGNATLYGYDALNRVTFVETARGDKTSYRYDAVSQLIGVTYPEGNTQEYYYDVLGRVTGVKDGVGATTSFAYDPYDNLIGTTDALGKVSTFEYDEHGIVTKSVDPLGNETVYDVALDGTVAAMTYPDGAQYGYSYDELKRVESVTSPLGLTRNFSYDVAGNIISEEDNLGRVTHYRYDTEHNLIATTNPLGAVASYQYDAAGNLIAAIDEKGGETSFAYDAANNLVGVTDAAGTQVAYEYDAAGNLVKEIQAGVLETQYSYDEAHQLTAVTTPKGTTTTISYDKNGRPVSQTDASGATSSVQYDGADRPRQYTDAAGNTRSLGYDAVGNLTSITDERGVVVRYVYDGAGQLVEVKEPSNRTTSVQYDAVGNITAVTDAAGQTAVYAYDTEGNITRAETAGGAVSAYEYDRAGRLREQVQPDGSVTAYDYDALNNLVAVEYPDETDAAVYRNYDAAGQRTIMADSTGTSTVKYDALGRITNTSDHNGRTVDYEYNELGLLASIQYSDGTYVSYTYDANGNPLTVTDTNGTTTYTYNDLDQVASLIRPNGVTSLYVYDARGCISKLENLDAAGLIISSYEYEYNEKGFIVRELSQARNAKTGVLDTTVRTIRYTANDELAGATETSASVTTTVAYTYDKAGNRVSGSVKSTDATLDNETSYVYDTDNQLLKEESTRFGTTEYFYDVRGNLIAKTGVDDALEGYTYDLENRLVAVRANNLVVMAAAYNGDGNRVFQLNRYEQLDTVTIPPSSSSRRETSTTLTEKIEGSSLEAKTTAPGQTADQASEATTLPAEQTPLSFTYTREVFKPAEDNYFWYGFSQGILQLAGSANALTLATSIDGLNTIWGGEGVFTTESTTIPLGTSPNLAQEDLDALSALGLEPEEVAALFPELGIEGTSELGTDVTQDVITRDVTTAIPGYSYGEQNSYFKLTHYVNDIRIADEQVLSEFGANNELEANNTYGTTRLSSTTTDATSYYLNDGRGSVTSVTDGAGKVTESYSFAVSGVLQEGGGQLPLYGYNAEEYNPTTQLTYLRARYVDPETGRFNTKDSVLGNVAAPITLNTYLYAKSNPVMYIDPSGHVAFLNNLKDIAKQVASGIVSGAQKVYDTIVKPTVTQVMNNVVAPAASWLNANVVAPLKQAGNNALAKIKDVVDGLAKGVQALKNITQVVAGAAKTFIGDKVEKAITSFVKFFCDTAEKIINKAIDLIRLPGRIINGIVEGGTRGGLFDPLLDIGLDITKGKDGHYHAGNDWVQKYFGFNDPFDTTFKGTIDGIGIITGSREGADSRKFTFSANGHEYVLWLWKGDYIGLGAGAEMGLYFDPIAGQHWQSSEDTRMNMTLNIDYLKDGTSHTWAPGAPLWWITDFDPTHQGYNPSDLRVTYTIDFTGRPEMWEAFKKQYIDPDNSGWSSGPGNTATFTW